MTSHERKRPPKARSTGAEPGGDAVTAAQDIEADERGVRDDHTVTRPADLEDQEEDRAEPDDAARTEPTELEPPERRNA